MSYYDRISELLHYVNGEVDLLKLAELLASDAFAGKDFFECLADVRKNLTEIFPDALSRLLAERLLDLLTHEVAPKPAA